MLVHIIDGKFDRSAAWLLLAAGFAATGVIHSPALGVYEADPTPNPTPNQVIHSPTLGVYEADQRFSAMYLIAAFALAVIHAVQNRGEHWLGLGLGLGVRVRCTPCRTEARSSPT